MKKPILLLSLVLLPIFLFAQGLKKIHVETYYLADSIDEVRSGIPVNSVTYRIFAELEEGYSIQTIFGFPENPLIIGSSTGFYNHNWGGDIGDMIDSYNINANGLGFDSWITIGAATKSHIGVPLNEDTDGSIVNKESLKDADGLIKDSIPQIFKYNMDLRIFEYGGPATPLIIEDGLIAVLGGLEPPASGNSILIAQLTTDGELFFQFNIQLGTPDGNFVQFVAKNPNPEQIQFDGLSYGTIVLNNSENKPDEE